MNINRNMVVLVVDDFEPMRKLTASLLRSIGFERVMFAANGADALRIIENQQVDMVLSDWNMPVMDGLELLKRLRASERFWSMPFIMITAEAERQRVREVIMSGVSDLLVKPYSPDRLMNSLEKAQAWKARKPAREAQVPAPKLPDAAAASGDGNVPDAKTAERPTILIVDDTPENLQLLSQLFKNDYRVKVAHSGQKALEICHAGMPPDLVLLDVMMPEMDGFEVARRLREHPNSETTPIIFVTAMDHDDARQKGMTLGAVDYVAKPIDPVLLSLRVRNFLRYVEQHKQLQANYDLMLELERVKEQVAHMTRHDITGPLSGVLGLLRGLQKDESLNRRQAAQVKMIEDAAMQVINLVNLTSELYKIETDTFTLKARPVDIDAQLRNVAELARVTFANKGLTIQVDTDAAIGKTRPPAFGDELFCYSVFQNLIKNACEAAPEKSLVSITLNAGDPQQIVIRNHGAVPVEIRDRFFEKFVTHGKQNGTGIGAYSARLLTEAQRGSIGFSVDDYENTTTVTVQLPCMPEDYNANNG